MAWNYSAQGCNYSIEGVHSQECYSSETYHQGSKPKMFWFLNQLVYSSFS